MQALGFFVGTAFKFKLFSHPLWKLSVCMTRLNQTQDMLLPSDYNPVGGRDEALGL